MVETTYKQESELKILEIILPKISRKTFLDIGAEKGLFTKFLIERKFIGIAFEPLLKFKKQLEDITLPANSKFLPYAIDNENRSASFYAAYDHEGNPLDYFSSLNPLSNDTRIKHEKVSEVICKSLNSLLIENEIDPHYGIIKIDTEGNDLKVLQGMTNISADVLMCEFFMPGIYSGWKAGHPQQLIETAKQNGFVHFLAIKRYAEFETASVNMESFVDKQWGNLLFFTDKFFKEIQGELNTFLSEIEKNLFDSVSCVIDNLRNTCEERLELIRTLDNECKKRQIIIDDLINNKIQKKK